MHSRSLNVTLLSFALLLLSLCAFAQGPAIPNNQLIQPEDLARTLSGGGPKPLILNVGPKMLYAQAHITGAEYVGAASEPQGIEALNARMKGVPKNKAIVIYCGCCPWSHCPNVEPAMQRLKGLGYTNVKALFIAHNIGTDWVYKGYPTVRGQ